MATNIEWCDETWNPTTGCTKISPGCTNCYAERMAKRLQAMGQPKYAAGFGKVVCHPDALGIPLRWKKPRRIFVNSMSDLFHKDVPFEFVDEVFAVMAISPQHTFQVLTKRPKRMAAYLRRRRRFRTGFGHVRPRDIDVLRNVHLGTTVENAEHLHRIRYLLECRAAGRFLSCEPLLGPLDVRGALGWTYQDDETGENIDVPAVDQVIIGCESGPNRRPCELDWVKSLVDQCDAAGVPPFVKQLDALRCRCGRVYFWALHPVPGHNCPECGMHECHMTPFVSADPAEWPEWARRREFPKEVNDA